MPFVACSIGLARISAIFAGSSRFSMFVVVSREPKKCDLMG